ncbi:hypothetical protein CA606_09190 [Caulobacter vibrioides]|uniref:Uncharacterized protein n=1 Tax=Caulobacter vibrioides TaxID=155892 RepID=A0A290MKI0_CAUVI|nr:hypothetical protein [Caulobacter vibrioides]ATC32508.1 hypothetical protein CA606_09190 [Caulobacter vibrioides]
MAVVEILSLEQAFKVFAQATAGEFDEVEIEGIVAGDWANPDVHIDVGHSEIAAPFMEAFVTSQDAIYKLVAAIKYGAADIRHLTNEDQEAFLVQVRVSEGSSQYLERIGEVLERLGLEAVGKLTPGQIVALVAGGLILWSGVAGWTQYLDTRKEVRLAEISSEERKASIAALDFANRQQAETTRLVIATMRETGGPLEQVVESADEAHGALLKAASTVPNTTVNGVSISRDEARELRKSARRVAIQQIVEREMKVIDINTSDPAHTSVVVEGVGDRTQYKLQFRDRMIQERDQASLFQSLRERRSIWLRLEVKAVGTDVRSVEILGVVQPPAPGPVELAEQE